MKRIAKILTIVLIVTCLLSLPTSAVELPIRVVVNGTKINFPDAEPFIDENSRTQVPIRFVGEALGADVSWDGNTKKVTITLNGKKVVLQIGNKNYEVNGQQKQMDTVALLKESRTFVPVRFVSEALGATVKWNANIRTVYIAFCLIYSYKNLTVVIYNTINFYGRRFHTGRLKYGSRSKEIINCILRRFFY